jgi:hypothetical protein
MSTGKTLRRGEQHLGIVPCPLVNDGLDTAYLVRDARQAHIQIASEHREYLTVPRQVPWEWSCTIIPTTSCVVKHKK